MSFNEFQGWPPPNWWLEGTPGYYRVRLEHPQFGVRLELVQSDTLKNAETAANLLYPGYKATWMHRQPPPAPTIGSNFSGARD